MTTPSKEAFALAEWREQNWHQLDESLDVLVSIRDSVAADPKERIEAVKGIARLLGAMSTRPADAMKPRVDPEAASKKPSMSKEEAAEVQEILQLRRYADRPSDKTPVPR